MQTDLVSDTLLVDSDTLNSEVAVLFRQPSRVQLVVGNDEQEDDANPGTVSVESHRMRLLQQSMLYVRHRQQTNGQEDNLPARKRRAILVDTLGDPIGYQASEDLGETIETEPYTSARALLLLGVPLRGNQREARRHSTLADTEEETDGDRAAEIRYTRETG